MVSKELLEILRCPVCVHNEPEGGELDYRGNWLICGDCERKYPVRDDIPVMLIDEGDRFREIPVEELPDEPPPEKAYSAPEGGDQVGDLKEMLPQILLAAAGVLMGLFLTWLLWERLIKKSRED